MKKYIGLLFIGLASGSLIAYSQSSVIGEMDALKYAQTQITGTAHYMGMAGAMSSLGGDISAISQNPAGIAVYRTSELATTIGLNFVNTKTDQYGSKHDESLTKFTFDNIGYIGTAKLRNSGSGVMNWNFGFVYNRLMSYDRNYKSSGGVRTGSDYSSLTDYIAAKTNGIYEDDLIYEKGQYDPYNHMPWMSVLGYEGNLIQSVTPGGNIYESAIFGNMLGSELNVTERGHVDTYDFTVGFNYSNLLYVGLTLGVTDLDYSYESRYFEDFDSDYFGLANGLSTEGTGINVKVGAILSPAYFWRIGLAYHSPTYYNMTDRYWGDVYNAPGTEDAYTPDGVTDYEINTPQKLLVGTSFILGRKGALSFDYEYCDYSSVKIKNDGGFNETPDYLKDDLKGTHTIKIGGEYMVIPGLAVRAGYAHVTSPLSSDVKNENVEIPTSGTIPHYTVDKGYNYYSCGLGYRYNNIFVDLTYVLKSQKEDLYAFSPMFYDGAQDIFPAVSSLKTNRSNVLLTFGVTF